MMKFPLSACASVGACALLRRSVWPLAALAACTGAAAQVQDGHGIQVAQNLHAPALEDMVVTATRTAQPLADTLADVSIVDRRTIEQSGAVGLADVLARLPGVEMVRNGGPATSTSLYLRGAETRYTAVYIDGVRVDSQAGSGGAAWEGLPLSMIERIEVVRGAAASVYGSDAVAGVVQIFTKKGEGQTAPYVGIGVGTYHTYKAETGLSGASQGVDYALGLARETSRGFNATTTAGKNPDRDDYGNTSAHARLGLQVNAAHRLEGTLLYHDSRSGYDASKDDDRSLRRLHTLGLTWQAQWSRTYTTRLSVTGARERYETTPSPYLTDTQLRGYLWQNEWRLGVHRITATWERREDQLENLPIDRKRSQNALALGYGLRTGAHTLQLNVRHDEDSEFGGQSTGGVAYGYALSPQWRATAALGTAFRAPTLYQRFSLYGEARLQPETSRNAEWGLRWAEGAQVLSATVYRNQVSNLINFVGSTGTCPGNSGPYPGCYANVGRARYEGVTLAGSTRLGRVQWRGSLDWQTPKNLDNNKLLARRARHHANVGAETDWSGWTLGAEAQASGARWDDAANTKRLGGYTLFNLYASTAVARDWLVQWRLDNLADKNYEIARGYATPGRSMYIGLRWMPG